MSFSHLLLAAFVILFAYGVYVHVIDSRLLFRLRRDFQSRPRPDLDVWYAGEFGNLGIARDRVMTLIAPIAEVLECDVTQLRGDDSFRGTLKWRGWLSPWDDYFEVTLWELTDDHDRFMSVFKRVFDGDPTLRAIISTASELAPSAAVVSTT